MSNKQKICENNAKMEVIKNAEDIKKVIEALGTPKISRYFYHYTSISVLFNILENDSIWITNTKFSNDGTEEKMLKLKNIVYYDNYMACFCDRGNQLSQWRGYCPNGGASIEFEINKPQPYSILHSDYEISGKYELVYNTPIPVIYISEGEAEEALDVIEKVYNSDINKIGKTVPYWKNDKFEEERESRLVFSNEEGQFSECIRFRTLSNGVKIPYMVLKTGDIGLFSRKCQDNVVDLESLEEIYKSKGRYVLIPEGSNQEQLFNETVKIVNEFNSKFNKEESFIKVYCAGHLPIKKIMLAPTYDRERLMEKVKRFCHSKYWLKNVEVTYSDIPYIPPSE